LLQENITQNDFFYTLNAKCQWLTKFEKGARPLVRK
jgi:hypothetical protein